MTRLFLTALVAAICIASTHEAVTEDPWKARVTQRLDLLETKIDNLVLSVQSIAERIPSSQPVSQKSSPAHNGADGTDSRQPGLLSRSGDDQLGHFDLSGFATILFIHEVWVFMQHANVLMNPYLQRMDRNYGIALLKKRLYWVIAGVLGAYWAREVGSLLLCYGYVSKTTQTMILLSSAYHIGKILLISLDAVRRFSPKLGIMSLVIDNWHLDSLLDVLVTAKRVILQGFDTAVHLAIVYDMCAVRPELWQLFVYVAMVWSFHTIACQVTKKSTATLFVEAFKHVIYGAVPSGGASKKDDDASETPDLFFSSEELQGRASAFEEDSQNKVLLVGAGSTLLLLGSMIATAMGRMSWFSLYVVVSLVAATLTSVTESVRCAKAGRQTKEMVRYLLSRDKPCAEMQRGVGVPGGSGSALRKVGHYAGWCAPEEQVQVPKLAFLAHPTTLSCAFALWARDEQGVGGKWEERLWMRLLWPIVWLYSVFWMVVSPMVCAPFLYMDHFEYVGQSSQVWLSRVFGWQYLSFPQWAHRNICATLREADRRGVRVLGLGALNKAEFVNKSGETLLNEVKPVFTRVVHGNTLTAATVAANVVRLLETEPDTGKGTGPSGAVKAAEAEGEARKRVFLTGPTSKVGRGVAMKLLEAGVDVVCHTSSEGRFRTLERECARAGVLRLPQRPDTCARGELQLASFLEEGVHCDVWVVGKFDLAVREHIPQWGTAVVFAVPCPLTLGGRHSSRADVRVVDGGLLRLDMRRCTPRSFPILLPSDTVYACHAAAIVHAQQGWSHHEVGEVDFEEMRRVMDAATELGISLPPLPAPHLPQARRRRPRAVEPGAQRGEGGPEEAAAAPEKVRVLVVGGGASGLSAAATLQEKGLGPVTVLERRGRIEGHWGAQYDELSITSRRDHCSLPLYSIPKKGSFPVSLQSEDFIRYLGHYAARFNLDVRLNQEVVSARRLQSYGAQGADSRWIVTLADGSVLEAEELVVASGLHARPVLPPMAKVMAEAFSGRILHSSQVRGLEQLAMQQVVIVGMGNSAVDVAMSLLDKGAPKVTMSVRTRPPVFMRQWGLLSVEWVSRGFLQYLPPRLGDLASEAFTVVLYGHQWWKGLFPQGLPSWQPYQSRRVPVIDKWAGTRAEGGFVDMIRSGRIQVVGPLAEARGSSVVASSSGGSHGGPVEVACDVLVFATGFEATHGDWLQGAELAAQDRSLHMVGFEHGEALLPLLSIRNQALRLARTLAGAAARRPRPQEAGVGACGKLP